MFEWVLLWTDSVFFTVLACIIVFMSWQSRHANPRSPWREVWKSPMAMSSLVIVLFYLLITILDSIHFRVLLDASAAANTQTFYAEEIKSVLDLMLAPLDTAFEKTYSAPFASHGFLEEPLELPGGEISRQYLPLSYVQEEVSLFSILRTFLYAVGASAVMMCTLVFIVLFCLSRGRLSTLPAVLRQLTQTEQPVIAWKATVITTSLVIVSASMLFLLSRHYHIAGTDKIGQDVFYQAIKSIRTAVLIGGLTTLVALPFSLVMGTIAGYFKGWVDDLVQYTYTTLSSIPSVLLISAMVLMLELVMRKHPLLFDNTFIRADFRLLALCCILGITSWTTLCRLLRAETMKLRELDYVQAAITMGVKSRVIMLRHIVPNVMHIVLITLVLDFSSLVLAEAVLSYVGIGVDPLTYSWGNMINQARLELARDPLVWWPLLSAFTFMFILVLSANLLADVVRKAFDPRLRGHQV